MDTRRLQTLQDPARIGRLLESLISSLNFLTLSAGAIADAAELPAALQLLAQRRGDAGRWRAWRDGSRLWFFVAELSLDKTQEHGRVVLRVTSYDADGEIVDSGWWIRSSVWRSL